jgi:predicted porin
MCTWRQNSLPKLSNEQEISMQKKLIAAAIAGLVAIPALAQTNVTISGRMSEGYENYKITGVATGMKSSAENRISDQSSRIRFNAVEDLGNGLQAWGQLELRATLDNGSLGNLVNTNNGNTGMGLQSATLGKITIGHWDVHYDEIENAIGGTRAGSLQTNLGNGIMSQVRRTGNMNIANATRTQNLVMWDSPNWNGVTARLAYSTGWEYGADEGTGVRNSGDKNPGGGSAWTGALRYNNGGIAAGLSYWRANSEDRNCVDANNCNDQRSWRVWGGYTFGFGLKVGLAYDRSKVNIGDGNNPRRGAWELPVSYEFGANKVYLSYARAGKVSGIADGSKTGANAWMLGYDYAFSKRTSAGVFYTKLKNQDRANYNFFGLAASAATPTGYAGPGTDARQL